MTFNIRLPKRWQTFDVFMLKMCCLSDFNVIDICAPVLFNQLNSLQKR